MGVKLWTITVLLAWTIATAQSRHMGIIGVKSIDEKIEDAMTIEEGKSPLPGSDVKTVEMDMLFKKEDWKYTEQVNGVEGSDKSEEDSDTEELTQKRNAMRDRALRWTNNEVVYEITPGIFDAEELAEIKASMAAYEQHTCLKFRERDPETDKNYIKIVDGLGCSSYVGMIGGVQALTLASGCRLRQIIIHELGHAIGFHHEQTRPDRDTYVTIRPQNIKSNRLFNFRQWSTDTLYDYGVPYDYRSIMHYGQNAFSGNYRATIVTKDRAYQNVIGTAAGLSFLDLKLVNLMYDCAGNCDNVSCPDNGYLGKDCQCYCGRGNPVRRCDQEPVDRVCRDLEQHCVRWAGQGYCRNLRTFYYMSRYCKKSCRVCRTGTEEKVCENRIRHCEAWALIGQCSHMPGYMLHHCRKACGAC